jgi:hypothetical protein
MRRHHRLNSGLKPKGEGSDTRIEMRDTAHSLDRTNPLAAERHVTTTTTIEKTTTTTTTTTHLGV